MQRHSARVARPARPCARWLLLLPLLALAACRPAPAPLPDDRLVVAVRADPSGLDIGPDGEPRGFEQDLVARFAREMKRPLVFVRAKNAADLADKLARGDAHLGVGGLHRSHAPAPPQAVDGAPLPLAWTTGFHPSEPVLIHAASGPRPGHWRDLKGARVAHLPSSGIDAELPRLKRAHPDIAFVPLDLPSADALIARVGTDGVDYAIVSSREAALARNIHLNFDIAFPAGGTLELAWLVPEQAQWLRQRLDAFLARARTSGAIDELAQRYFGASREIRRVDATVLQDRIRGALPRYRNTFFEAQEASGIEWRLLAAIAYQESQWDPHATSETGVRGFMQLTEETARHLGVADRLDARESILAAARYLKDLKARLPERIAEPDRTWLALAAFNIGAGHLEDARVLAQRQRLNPDAWRDVRQALPLLALPEHYEKTRLGYARGGMPVAFVDRVRSFYDILLRHEAAHSPARNVASDRT